MDLQLAGDSAVVFGAARGLGQAIAAAFAAEGVRVVRADVSPGGDEVLDVTDAAAVRACAGRFRVDHVVYAVGVGSGKFGFPFWNRDRPPVSRNRLVS